MRKPKYLRIRRFLEVTKVLLIIFWLCLKMTSELMKF